MAALIITFFKFVRLRSENITNEEHLKILQELRNISQQNPHF